MLTSLREGSAWNATDCTAEKHREVAVSPITTDSNAGRSTSSKTAVSKQLWVPIATLLNRGKSTRQYARAIPTLELELLARLSRNA